MDLRKFYRQKALDYGISKIREKKILELLPKKTKGLMILDVGCATGYLGQKIKKRGAKVFGVDISKKALGEASKVLSRVEFVDLNKQRLPFRNGYFNVIIASEVIEHLENPLAVLKEFNRVLKNHGHLIVTTPNFLYWGNRVRFLKGEFAYEKSGMFDEGHIHFYIYNTLKEDLAKAGFNVIQENHITANDNLFKKIKDSFPALFAYQFVIKCNK